MHAHQRELSWLNSEQKGTIKPYDQYLVSFWFGKPAQLIIFHPVLIHPPPESELDRGEFWTGLKNSNNEYCDNGGCVNKLLWDSDESYLHSWADTSHGIRVNSGQDCLRYTSDKMDDMYCTGYWYGYYWLGYYYICEFKCPGTRVWNNVLSMFSILGSGIYGRSLYICWYLQALLIQDQLWINLQTATWPLNMTPQSKASPILTSFKVVCKTLRLAVTSVEHKVS